MIQIPPSSNFQWFLRTSVSFSAFSNSVCYVLPFGVLLFCSCSENYISKISLKNVNRTRDCFKSVKWKQIKSWIWEKGLEAWTAIMSMRYLPCGAVFQKCLHQKHEVLIKNADSLSHPRPTDFGFLGLGHRNLYFEQVPVPTNVWEKTLPNCKCKS